MKTWFVLMLFASLLLGTPSVAQDSQIWQPAPGTTWQWQLSGTINTSWAVEMYDIDLFDTPTAIIDELRNAGRVVICYFSAGSYEDWRSDADEFPASVLGNPLAEWPGERWLDIRELSLLGPIMSARLDLAVQKGCDGVEPDNVDGYTNHTGFSLSYDDQLAYNRWLAREAHARNLSIGLKNDLDQIPDLLADFDWALNEQCFEYDECDALLPFIEAGKAVFGVEYEGERDDYCPHVNRRGFSWLTKTYELADEPPSPCAVMQHPTQLRLEDLQVQQVQLRWRDNSNNETEFWIERSLDGRLHWEQVGSVPAESTNFIDRAVTPGTLYYYRVRAYRETDNVVSMVSNVLAVNVQ